MHSPLITPSRRALFSGFFLVGIQGFGGVLPLARRMLVEQRRWLSEGQFTEILGLGQLLPGPNIVNVAVVVGARYHGWLGACLAVLGLLAAPLLIVLSLALLYDHYGRLPALQHILAGISAAAAGLVVGMGGKLLQGMERSRWCGLLALATLLAVTVLRLPLLAVLLVLAPIGLLLGYRTQAKGKP